ncbi:MAG TPA: hypothetical protein PKM58_07830, partial [Pyrinomonadaceae bacterium]|nr:hypothetical protein [Pyrinomonadaceae bacterium]
MIDRVNKYRNSKRGLIARSLTLPVLGGIRGVALSVCRSLPIPVLAGIRGVALSVCRSLPLPVLTFLFTFSFLTSCSSP